MVDLISNWSDLFFLDKHKKFEITEHEFKANNKTFKVLLKNDMTWYDALALCKRNGMDLASVADTYQQAVLSVLVSKAQYPFWIGLFSNDV